MPASQTHAAARSARQSSDWIGLGDASALLGISAATLRRWSDDGRIPVFTTPGGHRRYSRRALSALVPRRRERPPLAGFEASTERIARAYRSPSHRRRLPAADRSWVVRLEDVERAEFRQRGRMLVEELLLHLDAESGATSEHLDRAAATAAAHGRAMAERGCSTVEAVETFLQFRTPFLEQIARIVRRRGLDAQEATGLLSTVESALDRLLVATIEGHAGVGPKGPGEEAPSRAAQGRGGKEMEGTGPVPL